MVIISFYVIGCFYSYKKTDDVIQYYLKSVIYVSEDNFLVPISLNFHNEIDLEQEIYNRIEMMKSEDLVDKGLYPLLDKSTVINHIDFIDNILTIDFKSIKLSNNNNLDFIESILFMLSDYSEIDNIELTLNDEKLFEDYSYIYNSNNFIGLNNFVDTNELLHHTYSVMIYQNKLINNREYMVPVSTRISNQISLLEQIQIILDNINSKISCEKADIIDNELYLELDSNILIEDGKIDKNLYNQIILTLSSLKDIKEIHISINNEDIIQDKVNSEQINYIKI